MAQRSEEEGMEEWAAAHAGELQGTGEAKEESFAGGVGERGLDSQRMQVKGWQGNQTRSLPVSR